MSKETAQRIDTLHSEFAEQSSGKRLWLTPDIKEVDFAETKTGVTLGPEALVLLS
jgi:hypothetical protein